MFLGLGFLFSLSLLVIPNPSGSEAMGALIPLMLAAQVALAASSSSKAATFPGQQAAFTVPAAFPTSVWSEYYGKTSFCCALPSQLACNWLTQCPISQAGTDK